jgi:acetyl-CoA acetyltransferase family protein
MEAKLPSGVPAFTVSRDGASGMQAVIEAALRIRAGESSLAVAVGVESMSAAPLLFPEETRAIWAEAEQARGLLARGARYSRLRPRHIRPVPAGKLAGADRITGAVVEETANRLADEFDLGREKQDRFALRSHRLAAAAWDGGIMAGEVVPVPLPPTFESAAEQDDGVLRDLKLEDLAGHGPVSGTGYGTVTRANSARNADGAVALVLASPARAAELGLQPLGRLLSWAVTGGGPGREGLGAVWSVATALRRAGGIGLHRIECMEIEEAFAAETLAVLKAISSSEFCEENLGRDRLGEIDPDRVNVNGGAIAIGRPAAASGLRMLLSLVREMERTGLGTGMAALSAESGQGAALILERG